MTARLNRTLSGSDPSRVAARLAVVLLPALAVAACRKPEPPPAVAEPGAAAPADRLATGPAGEAQAQGREMLRAGRAPEAMTSLGDAARADEVEVTWTDGTSETWREVEGDRAVVLERGSGMVGRDGAPLVSGSPARRGEP